MKWKQAMADNGLTLETLSNSVKRKVAEYNDTSENLQAARKALKDAPNDKKKKEIEGDIETMENGLLRLDTKLCKDMVRLNIHKDRYANMAGRLKPKQAKPKAAATVETTTAAASVQAEEKSAAPTATTKSEATTPKPTEKPKAMTPASPSQPKPPAKTEKKKNNTGAIVFGVVLAVLTVGTIGYFKWWKKT